MEPESLQRIQERCQQARRYNDRMRTLLPREVAPNLRVDFARSAVDLALEHHSGFIRVVEASEYGTAGALLRPIIEAASIGYWFVYAAPCERIHKLSIIPLDSPLVDIPTLGEILPLLRDVFPAIQKMIDGFKPGGEAKWLHKYAHGGTPQLTRRGGRGWTEGEVVLGLIRADMFATLAFCLESAIAPNVPLAAYGFGMRDKLAWEVQSKYTLSEPIPHQPHGLPASPLLMDGCGPPFA